MTRSGGNVTIAFMFNAGAKATRSTYNLMVEPVLRGGFNELELTPIVIQGRRSKVIDARHELISPANYNLPSAVYMAPGTSTQYSVTVPYADWMRGSQLVFDGVSVGCCSSKEVELGLLAENVLYAEPQTGIMLTEVRESVPQTVGAMLAEQYPFVASEAQYDEIVRAAGGDRRKLEQMLIDDAREGSVSVYFGQGLRMIDSDFADNNQNLVELISAVRAIMAAKDSEISRIVIAGFASPEGSMELNDRLAGDRAEAVSEFLVENSSVDPYQIDRYNMGVDWQGLRELVADSRMPQRRRILDILDNVPVWDSGHNAGRQGELMRLDGGQPYRYMLQNFFPQLRQAAYIKVYYK
jgi:outer membrane protein OmpA-like peptidoglycan-associated protein